MECGRNLSAVSCNRYSNQYNNYYTSVGVTQTNTVKCFAARDCGAIWNGVAEAEIVKIGLGSIY